MLNINDPMAEVWFYTRRREMQEILPGLYLGPYISASKTKVNNLVNEGITHIICIRQTLEASIIKPNFPDKFKYLVVDMVDCFTQSIMSHIDKCKVFIDECLSSGGKCLVHGHLGVSRSAAIVIAFVMQKKALTFEKALEFVREKRFCISPNDSFKQQLQEYEAIYKAQRTLLNGQCSQDKGKLKRKFDDTEDVDRDYIEPMDQNSL